ncbi:hypothetical protein CCHR01_01128 [Colletotrichum chrysophilum]|uniref:Heterokaryon incompatibility domain-containing protein n=1 Tax=Colletotrichum chrysophilum TaxID=1836956 RepID=A0AAD9ETK9_9PEZI|nr:hypothetical protein CCHR01_01128 [Colletotrichum chrysophilum]
MPEMNPYQKWVFVPTLEFWYQALLRYFHQPDPPRRQVPFVTQSLHDNDGLPQTGRWVCTGRPPARVPPLLRVSYWIGSSLLVPGTHEYRADFRSLSLAVLKLIIAWPLLFLLVLWSENLGLFRHSANTKLDSVQSLYGSSFSIDKENKHHPNYLKSDASPPSQSSSLDSPSDDNISVIMTTSGTHGNGIGPMDALPDSQYAWTEVAPHINTLSSNIGGGRSRDNDDLVSVRPRYLCIVKDFKRMHYATIKVSDYLDHYGDHIDLDFIFVSYTRMQFRVATEEEIDNYPYESEATRDANREVAQADRVTLIKWGMEAAQRANISAFWIDFECIRNDDGSARSTSSSGDVYHICDIVRAAHSMIIAIGPAASDKVAAILEGRSPPAYSQDRITPWLRQWGSRLWTLPEVLLCPSEHRIQLYALGDRSESNLMIAKRNFAERAWDDAAVVNELVHHFEGTATLTPHHFIEVALECFSRRQTDHFSQGDVAYATMGLFPIRQRPLVDKHDTGFQAFAKLCLCNSNSDFLGCLICLAPQPGEQWFRIGDRWSTKLSEIRPLSTIRKVGTGNTIILDNANGFPIHWDGLHPEPYFEENDGSGSAYFFNIALMWCCSAPFSGFFSRSILSNFAGFLPITAIFALVAPVMLLRTRTRIRVPATPRLIGIEGFVDLSTLEKHLWGLNHGNLTDSTPLSYQDIGMGQMQSISDEELHSFTLLDTHLMTVTRFRSSVPPVAMFVVGEEGEKHRTLLCSYDHITQTFHREEVLRCDRRELKKESKLSGVRLSLASQPRRTDVLQSNVRFNRISWWAMEVMFLGICLTGFSLFDLIEYPQWKSNPQPTTSSYRMAMIIGQIPAWMIVSYTARPLETLPYILTSKCKYQITLHFFSFLFCALFFFIRFAFPQQAFLFLADYCR